MVNLNTKLVNRFTKGIQKFQPVIQKALASDINESDTVTIIVDILCDVFGYDKYDNITSEFAIRKTFCDLAIKLDDERVPYLIECKAIGVTLKQDHIRQALGYATNAGIEWVVLTNGINWMVYKVLFSKPVDAQLVYEFNFLDLNVKKNSDLENLYYLSIETFTKSSKATLEDLYAEKQVLNKYNIGQLILTEMSINSLRKILRKIYPELKIDNKQLEEILIQEVLKRDVVEGDDASNAKREINKILRRMEKAKEKAKAE